MAEKGRGYNTRSRKKSQETKEVVTIEVSDDDNVLDEDSEPKIPDCAICLQSCSYPARLPCRHIFCFLCLKGAALNNRRCPMCRSPIPHDYLDNPEILEVPKPLSTAPETYKWYYEGRHGWWEYDARTSRDLETAFLANEHSLEVLLAGAIFIIDFARMTQIRKIGRGKTRQVKRDKEVIPTKGVAGIRKHRRLPQTPEEAAEEVERRRERINMFNYDNFVNEGIARNDILFQESDEEGDYVFDGFDNVEGSIIDDIDDDILSSTDDQDLDDDQSTFQASGTDDQDLDDDQSPHHISDTDDDFDFDVVQSPDVDDNDIDDIESNLGDFDHDIQSPDLDDVIDHEIDDIEPDLADFDNEMDDIIDQDHDYDSPDNEDGIIDQYHDYGSPDNEDGIIDHDYDSPDNEYSIIDQDYDYYDSPDCDYDDFL